jgi:hypothetical protein
MMDTDMYIVLFCNEFGEINHANTPINANSYDAARAVCKEYRNIEDGLFTRIYKCRWCPESATMNANAVETFADNIAS